VSNYSGSQTVDTLACQAARDQPGIASLQTEYSLLNRSRETEIRTLSTDHGLGIIAWGALGRGVLTGKYQSGTASRPGTTEFFDNYIAPLLSEESAGVVAAVVDIARELGCAPAAVAAAWVLRNPAVDATLVGASTENQLSGSLMGGMLTLPDDTVALLDDVSRLPIKL
jgi:aryl-alcohol dehydrogenase-like predicted oxidoreductase